MTHDLYHVGDASPCFAFSKPPIGDESLMGFVARNCEVHGITKVAAALRPVGFWSESPTYLATAHADKAEALGHLFMTTTDEVVRRMYLPVTVADVRHGEHVAFFGTPLRKDLLQFRRRRFSPSSLARSAHHRAAWDIRVFSFCQDSREHLISSCPVCGGALGWRWTYGIGRCDHCGRELSEMPGAPIACDDLEALDFVCDLVHPLVDRRDRARALVPVALSALSLLDLFELVFELACVAVTDADAVAQFRPQVEADYDRLTPQVLAQAGRALMGWPGSMHAFADGVRADAGSRPGFWGATKELGPLVVASRRDSISPPAKKLLRDFIRDDVSRAGMGLRRSHRVADDLITVTDAYKEFQFSKATLRKLRDKGLIQATLVTEADRSIVLVRREEIARMAVEQRDAMSRIDVSKALGVDYLAVARLAEAGLLVATGPAVSDLLVGDHYARCSVDALAMRMRVMAVPGSPDVDGAVSLAKAAAASTAKVVPWVGIVLAVLSGNLRVHELPGEADAPVMERLVIEAGPSSAKAIARLPHENLPDYGDRRINTHEAAAILAIPAPIITYLTQDRQLTATDNVWFRLRASDVLEFHARHVSNQEVARRAGLPGRAVIKELSVAGVSVFSPDPAGKTRFWDRSGADAVMLSR